MSPGSLHARIRIELQCSYLRRYSKAAVELEAHQALQACRSEELPDHLPSSSSKQRHPPRSKAARSPRFHPQRVKLRIHAMPVTTTKAVAVAAKSLRVLHACCRSTVLQWLAFRFFASNLDCWQSSPFHTHPQWNDSVFCYGRLPARCHA